MGATTPPQQPHVPSRPAFPPPALPPRAPAASALPPHSAPAPPNQRPISPTSGPPPPSPPPASVPAAAPPTPRHPPPPPTRRRRRRRRRLERKTTRRRPAPAAAHAARRLQPGARAQRFGRGKARNTLLLFFMHTVRMKGHPSAHLSPGRRHHRAPQGPSGRGGFRRVAVVGCTAHRHTYRRPRERQARPRDPHACLPLTHPPASPPTSSSGARAAPPPPPSPRPPPPLLPPRPAPAGPALLGGWRGSDAASRRAASLWSVL